MINSFMTLIIQTVVFSYSAHNVITYGSEFDGIRLFLYLCFGFTLGTTICSVIMTAKARY